MLMIVQILDILINVVITIIIVQAIMSWLLAFNVINLGSELVSAIWTALQKLTDPIYRPIRRIMPDFGAIDLTPMVVLLILIIIQGPVLQAVLRAAYA